MLDKGKDWLDPKAEGKKTSNADFERNRQGLYGGLPEVRLTLVKESSDKIHPHAGRQYN